MTPTTTLVAGVDRLLGAVRGLLNLALDEPCSIAASVPPAASMRSISARASVLDRVGHLLDRVRPAQRVDGVGDAGFCGDDLLRAERDPRGFFGRQRQRFVAPVAVQRLGAAEDGGQRLKRDADDVVIRLLGGQRAACRLRVEAQLLRARVASRRSGRA